MYTLPEGVDPFPVDPDVSACLEASLPNWFLKLRQIDDVFNMKTLEKGQRLWNTGEYVYWPAGNLAYKRAFMDGNSKGIPVALEQVQMWTGSSCLFDLFNCSIAMSQVILETPFQS